MHSQTRMRATVGIALAVLLLLGGATSGLAAAPEQAEVKASPDNPVDINNATAAALTTVPGIGKVTAERIVQWRKANGPFRRIEDLLKVKGIGDKTIDKLRPYLKVGKSR